jgi:hypothetical protein
MPLKSIFAKRHIENIFSKRYMENTGIWNYIFHNLLKSTWKIQAHGTTYFLKGTGKSDLRFAVVY